MAHQERPMCHHPPDITDDPNPVVLGMIPALKKRLICLKLWFLALLFNPAMERGQLGIERK
jgi:hypothetical protein